jgi:uncharacterized membrane protein
MTTAITQALHKLRSTSRSFWFLPSVLGLLGIIIASMTIYLDRRYETELPLLSTLGAVTTRSVLETIATASITVISLTFSLTLVVFTLAAGNIAPRLLTRFRESMFTRISIGVFCCCFLFSISVLAFIGEESPPKISAIVGFLFAIMIILVLIGYVNHVSIEVLVDNEVADAVMRARSAIDDIMQSEGDNSHRNGHEVPSLEPSWRVASRQTGYVLHVDPQPMISAAQMHDCALRVLVAPGDFIIEGISIAVVSGSPDEEIERAVACDAILIGPSRQPDHDVGFLIHLVVEIALRALSPGVNDAYTAVSCIDNLSAVLSQLMQGHTPSLVHCDDKGVPRVHFEPLNVPDMLQKTLVPLRVSARGNIIVTLRLLQALQHMAELALPLYRDHVRHHAEMVLADAEVHVTNASDLDVIRAAHAEIIVSLDKASSAQAEA